MVSMALAKHYEKLNYHGKIAGLTFLRIGGVCAPIEVSRAANVSAVSVSRTNVANAIAT
jgi:hypothetical protein